MRLEIYNENNELIGLDYTFYNDDGRWMHKWIDIVNPKNKFEPFSWPGRAKGENQEKWMYKEIEDY